MSLGVRAGSLFSGIGGLDLGLHAALGCEPAWFCEIDKHAVSVLQRHWPDVPVLPDVRDTDELAAHGPVDVLHGGYPCQPFSHAGKRGGADDPRHLWPAFASAVRVLRPRLVIGENVAGHITLGFDTVLGDLAEMGFAVRWGVVRASDTGAPHQRARLFWVAWDTQRARADALAAPSGSRDAAGESGGAAAVAERERQHRRRRSDESGTPGVGTDGRADAPGRGAPATYAALAERRSQKQHRVGAPVGSAAEHRERAGEVAWGIYEPAITRWEHATGQPAPRPTDDRGRLMPAFVEWMMGFPAGWVDGLSRTSALRCLGNAVVPAQAELTARLLLDERTERVAA